MKNRRRSILIYCGILGLWCLSWGCSTTQVAPPSPPSPPTFTQVPHPSSYELGDMKGLFYEQGAPDRDSLKDCDKGFFKLKAATASVEEQKSGIAELVRHDPVAMHWCFYDRVSFLEDELKKELYVDARQKKVLTTYEFLVPIARAYSTEFHDSRYLRAAIQRYRKLSEWVFYRRLDISPKVTSELVEMATPFGIWKEPGGPTPVLEKYGVVQHGPGMLTMAAPGPVPATAPLGTEQNLTQDQSPVLSQAPMPGPTPTPLQPPALTPTPIQTQAAVTVPPAETMTSQGQAKESAMVPGGRAPAATPNNQVVAAQPEPIPITHTALSPNAPTTVTESTLNGDEVVSAPPAMEPPAAPATTPGK